MRKDPFLGFVVFFILILLSIGFFPLFGTPQVPSFQRNVQERGLDKSFSVKKMEVNDPNIQQNLYFVRALFVSMDNDNYKSPVQGVKIKWSFSGGDYITTLPLDKVKFVVDPSMLIPEFRIDWDHFYLNTSSRNYNYLFQYGEEFFNPNDLLGDPEYYSQIEITMNQAEYDLVMSYIFK